MTVAKQFCKESFCFLSLREACWLRQPAQTFPTLGVAQKVPRGDLHKLDVEARGKGCRDPVPTLQAQLPGFKSRPYHFTVSKFSCHPYNGDFDKNIYQVSQFWWFNQLLWLKHPEPCLPWTVWIKLPGSTPSPGVGKTSASRIRRRGCV